jgi:hypothetical protein
MHAESDLAEVCALSASFAAARCKTSLDLITSIRKHSSVCFFHKVALQSTDKLG